MKVKPPINGYLDASNTCNLHLTGGAPPIEVLGTADEVQYLLNVAATGSTPFQTFKCPGEVLMRISINHIVIVSNW